MAIASVGNLVELLRQGCLLEPARQGELAVLQARFPEPRALARELIRRDWLTPYQVNQLFQDRGADLVLGQYVLLERLGEGGMGQVFKARHRSLGRTVALKVVRKERLANPVTVRRFRREIQALAQLSHPNVVLAFDADEAAGTHFFAMEYVEGTDLSRLVKTRGPLAIPQACDYVRQAALGLQHAHERGLVHRDIKPSNLLVAGVPGASPDYPWGVVKILDLGLARLDRPEQVALTTLLTQDNLVLGTPDFIAPEQARSAHTIDIRADLYSLGCTFYFLLTGQVPFTGASFTEKLIQHQLDEAPAVEGLRPSVPPVVAALVRRLMAKRPEDRLQMPAELAAALDKIPSKATRRCLRPVLGGQAAASAATRVRPATPPPRKPAGASGPGPTRPNPSPPGCTTPTPEWVPPLPQPRAAGRRTRWLRLAVGALVLLLTALAVAGLAATRVP